MKKDKYLKIVNAKFLIIEGHYRMTVYGFDPSKLEGTFAYVGYCTPEEMKKYDARMLLDSHTKR